MKIDEFNASVAWQLEHLRTDYPNGRKFHFFLRHNEGIDLFVYDFDVSETGPVYVAGLCAKALGELATVPGIGIGIEAHSLEETLTTIALEQEQACA